MAPWIPVVASFLANRNQEKDAREQMRQQLLQQYASSLGAPSYEMQAANFNKQQRDANGGFPNLMSMIQLVGSMGKKTPEYTGPGKVGRAGYAGPIRAGDFY